MAGRKKYEWTKERDELLISEISKGKNKVQLTISLKVCYDLIERRLKQMGFANYIDARQVLTTH